MSQEKNNEGLNLSKKYASVLVKPTETVIATYGNDYFQNIFASKNFQDFSFILTNKRLYYKGTHFQLAQNRNNTAAVAAIGTTLVEEVIDLNNITKSGIEHFNYNPLGLYIGGIVWIVCGILMFQVEILVVGGFMFVFFGILFFVLGYFEYMNKTFTAIKFDYAGGSLCGNIKLYGETSARDFLKQVKRAQDECK